MKLLEQYRELHAQGQFPGWAIRPFAVEIGELIAQHGSRTVLDYGCGAGLQYSVENAHRTWGLMPTLYEPAVPGLDVLPSGRFDGVLSTDVIEHVPEDELPQFVGAIARYARQWAFISVCCRPAKRKFADGSNVHVTIRPFAWWQAYLAPHFPSGGPVLTLRETR